MIKCKNGKVEVAGTGMDLISELCMAVEAIAEAGDVTEEFILSLMQILISAKGEAEEEEDGEEDEDDIQEERSGEKMGDFMSKLTGRGKRTYRRG